MAAEAALGRIRARLPEADADEVPVETQFSLPDQWSRLLFVALARHYRLTPYRRRGQRRNSVMILVPKGFVDHVLWPEFVELNEALKARLHQTTLNVIHEEIVSETPEAGDRGGWRKGAMGRRKTSRFRR